MDDIVVERSLRLLSLDTHPANLILLVNYEIDVKLINGRTKQEVARRSKQSQLQIHLKTLEDRLNIQDDEGSHPNSSGIEQMTQVIIQECPMINENRSEEIKHHLTYLRKRHSEQIKGDSCTSTSGPETVNRLIKGARVKSAAYSKTTGHGNSKLQTENKSIRLSDFTHEVRNNDMIDAEHYISMFSADQQLQHLEKSDINMLNKYIEGLYDELYEKVISSIQIRSLAESTENLMELVLVNKMLTSAMYRVLREDGNKSALLAKNVLIYFIKISSFVEFIDILRQYDLASTALTLARNLYNSLVISNRSTTSRQQSPKRQQTDSQDDDEVTLDAFRACLVLMFNLCQLDKIYENQLCQSGLTKHLTDCVATLTVKLLALEVMTSPNHDRNHSGIIKLLTAAITILQRLSTCKQNIDIIKQSDLITNMIKILDMSSRRSNPSRSMTISSEETVNKGKLNKKENSVSNHFLHLMKGDYELLVIASFRLVNNLLCDQDLREQLNKNKLFKISIRIFIAYRLHKDDENRSREADCRSMVSFSSLAVIYRLSCDNKFKKQIAKSRLICKCLLDYMKNIASTMDDRQYINLCKNGTDVYNLHPNFLRYGDDSTGLNLEPIRIDHLMVAFVLNLTTSKYFIASINQYDIANSLSEYVKTVMSKLDVTKRVGSSSDSNQLESATSSSSSLYKTNEDIELNTMLYLHLKVIRNITQFYSKLDENIRQKFENDWFFRLMSFSMENYRKSSRFSGDMILESLGIIGNYAPREGREKMKWRKLVDDTSIHELFLHNLDISRNLTDDDTLLIVIYTLGTLLDDTEIWDLMSLRGLANRLKKIISLRRDDEEIVIHSLYALYHLLNDEEVIASLSSKPAFMDQLINFTNHTNECIVKYSSLVLELFTETSNQGLKKRIIEGRFLVHNSKWLSMIDEHSNNVSRQNKMEPVYLDVEQGEDFDENSEIVNYSIMDAEVLEIASLPYDLHNETDDFVASGTSSSSSNYNKLSDQSLVEDESDFDSDLSDLVRQATLGQDQRWQQSVRRGSWNKIEDRQSSRPQTSYQTRHQTR